MKKIKLLAILSVVLLAGGLMSIQVISFDFQAKISKNVSKNVDVPEFKDGDIIFQISQSEQCKAVQLATKSKYAHCGIIFKENGNYRVLEAVQPVQSVSLESWIKRGERGHYVVKRLIDSDRILTSDILKKLKKEGKKFLGRNYDITFEWNDDKIYCSELVWKAYKRATGLEIGELQKLRDMDLSSELVKRIMKERYGNNIPLDEIVITPASIFASKYLHTVYSN